MAKEPTSFTTMLQGLFKNRKAVVLAILGVLTATTTLCNVLRDSGVPVPVLPEIPSTQVSL